MEVLPRKGQPLPDGYIDVFQMWKLGTQHGTPASYLRAAWSMGAGGVLHRALIRPRRWLWNLAMQRHDSRHAEIACICEQETLLREIHWTQQGAGVACPQLLPLIPVEGPAATQNWFPRQSRRNT